MCKQAVERMTTGLASEWYEHDIGVKCTWPKKVVPTPGAEMWGWGDRVSPDQRESPETICSAILLLCGAGGRRRPGAGCRARTCSTPLSRVRTRRAGCAGALRSGRPTDSDASLRPSSGRVPRLGSSGQLRARLTGAIRGMRRSNPQCPGSSRSQSSLVPRSTPVARTAGRSGIPA